MALNATKRHRMESDAYSYETCFAG